MEKEQSIVRPREISGFPEWLPEERIAELRLIDKIRATFELYGFAPIETPAVELLDILRGKGEIKKQIYRLATPVFSTDEEGAEKVDWNPNDLALHFDLTVPLARYVALNHGRLTFPFRRYQIQKVWRGERPQKKRYREFYQCDIDIIGDGQLGALADAEIPCVIYSILAELKVGTFKIYMNNRKVLEGLLRSYGLDGDDIFGAMAIIDEVRKIGEANVRNQLMRNLSLSEETARDLMAKLIKGVGADVVAKLEATGIDNEQFREGLGELRQLDDNLRMFGLPADAYVFDLSIARGLDYYTGTVYETMSDQFPDLSFCSGGRYENLASNFTNKKLPGVGISIGLSRLFVDLKEAGALNIDAQTPSQVLVTVQDRELLQSYMRLTSYLRSNGIKSEIYLESKDLNAQLKYANRKKIPLVIIANREEDSENRCQLKNMVTGGQRAIDDDHLITEVQNELKALSMFRPPHD